MIVKPGESKKLGDASKIRVTNQSDEKKGSFSVTGMSKVLEPNASVDVNLMENDDSIINSGKTDLNVDVLSR